jgi:hypothetical protein
MSRKALLRTASAIVLGFGVYSASPALANQEDMCEIARTTNLSDLDTRFTTAIAASDEQIAAIKAKGGDPEAIAIKVDGKFYTLPELRGRLVQDRATIASQINAKADNCNKNLEPLQHGVDTLASAATYGLTDVLPGKMGYVDVSRILAGYPLGGPDAFIPRFREQVLAVLGATGPNNDLAKVLRNPLGGRCSFVRNPFGNGC